jgi:CSLREA domain-containing protein
MDRPEDEAGGRSTPDGEDDMATFTVTTLADDDGIGEVTLREAITAANTLDGEDRIVFADGLAGTIALDGSALTITDSVVIDGAGDITVDAGGESGVFAIAPGDTDMDVTMAEMTVKGGFAESGAGLFIGAGGDGTADVTLVDMIFSDNTATGDDSDQGGGAVYLEDGTLGVIGSTFIDNAAVGEAGSGGHLFLERGTMTVLETLLQGGSATRAGGAIEIGAGGELNVLASVLALNSTGDGPGNGGAIHVTGSSDVLIDDSSILANVASAEGGGVWNNAGSTMVIRDSVIRNNIANGDLADQGGGGVFNNGGDLTITGSDISLNVAAGEAGSGGNVFSTDGSVDIDGSTINRGTAERAGGGVEIIEGDVTIEGSTFDRNATGSAPGNGGGLHVTGGAEVEVRSSTFRNNEASEGGALWNSATGAMILQGNFFAANRATGDAADQGGGAVFNKGGTLSSLGDIFRGNVADGASGSGGHVLTVDGAVTIDDAVMLAGTASRAGGAVEIIGGTLDMDNALFVDNETGEAPGNGGAIHVTADAATTITGSSFVNNIASAEGGAIWNSATGVMTLVGLSVEGNSAGGDAADQGGGGVFNNGGTLTISDSAFDANTATGAAGSGGHVLTVAGDVVISGTAFEDGDAPRAGGAIEIIEGLLDVIGSTFTANTTGDGPGNGGAIHATGAADILIDGSLFRENAAGNEGGAIWNSAAGILEVLSSGFFENEAPSGGALFSDGGLVFVGTAAGEGAPLTEIADNRADDGAVVMVGSGALESVEVLYGADQVVIGSEVEDAFEGASSDDVVDGAGGADFLLGAGGDDILLGGEGSDILSGGTGVNALSGGGGADIFAFFDAEDPGVSTIIDFEAGDTIALEDRLFDRGGTGINPRAVSAELAQSGIEQGLFAYDGESGEITIDADGFGGADGQIVAVIDGGGSIDATDFLLF